MTLYHVTLSLAALTSAGLGIFIFLKNPRARTNVTWFFLALSVSGWALGCALYIFAKDYDFALAMSRLCNYSASLIPVFFAHFCLALVKGPPIWRTPIPLGYAFNAALLPRAWTPAFVQAVAPKSIFTYWPVPGPWYHLFAIQFAFFVCYGHYLLIRRLRQPADQQTKNQISYVLATALAGFISGTPALIMVYTPPFEPWSVHFMWIYNCIMAYAILKHHLLDINVVIRKSVIYSTLIACITAFYFGVVYLMSLSFGSTIQMLSGRHSVATTLVAMILVALLFKPMERRIQKFLDHTFFKDTAEAIARENGRLRAEMVRAEQMKAISLLASGMAHEIKNPLTAIKTFVEHLKDRHQDPEFCAKFQRIATAEIEKINATVHHLLAFAKPQSTHQTDVSISQLLDDTLELLSNNLLQRRIRVERHYDGVETICGDATQLKQVFLNLFLNSLDAMNGSGGTLTVRTNHSNGSVNVIVGDSGCGIPPDQLERVFEPFYTTKRGGTGLGLSVVQQLVTQHGGSITVTSQPSVGTTFTMAFPSRSPDVSP